MASWNEDLSADVKARRAKREDAPVSAEVSCIAKAVKAMTRPTEQEWETTHDSTSAVPDDAPSSAANIQGEQVPLKLRKSALDLVSKLRPRDEYGLRAPVGKTAKDDEGASMGDVEMAAKKVCPACGKSPCTCTTEKAEWSTAAVNDFPDANFLYVEPGGKKDEGDKTTPRDLRHFPVKGSDGKPDAIHIRNALGRIPQSGLSDKVKAECSAKATKMLDEVNDTTEKATDWPADMAAHAKGNTSVFGKALAKVLAAKADDLGDEARAHTKEPEATERGKVDGGAVPVRPG